jgi:hypothetical protein
MALQIATRNSWKTLPAAGEFETVPYKDVFDAAEMAKLERGLIPQDMEDKWFSFFERPFLYLHRSWTGHLVYRVKVLTSEGAGQVERAEVLRTPDGGARYPGEYEAELLRFLIRCVILGQELPFPAPPLPADVPRGLFQSVVAGTGQDEARWSPIPWWKRWLRRSTRR